MNAYDQLKFKPAVGPLHVMNPQETMSDALLRQRRNLLVLSLLIAFLTYANVELGKLSVLGIEFAHFERPEAVRHALWIGWIYFLFRYVQHFYQEGRHRLAEVFWGTLDEFSQPMIKRLVLDEHPDDFRENCNFRTLRKWGWVYHGQEKAGRDQVGQEKINNFEMPIAPAKLWREIAMSIFTVTFAKSAGTDYLLPFIVAATTAIYAGPDVWKSL